MTAAQVAAPAVTCTYWLWLARGPVEPAYAVLALADAVEAMGLRQVTGVDLVTNENGTYAVAGCCPAT